MSYQYKIILQCQTIELNSYAYKYSDSKELTKILRRVQATGIDEFLQFKAFKVGTLKYTTNPKTHNHFPISIRVEGDGKVLYMSDDWQPKIYDRETFNEDSVDSSLLDYMFDFNNSMNFNHNLPEGYNRILVEKSMYTGIHRYFLDEIYYLDENNTISLNIDNLFVIEAPFRSYNSRKEDNILLDVILQFDKTKLHNNGIFNRAQTSILERQPANYRCNTFFKIPYPNYNIGLKDPRFEFFDYWKNL